MLPVDRCQFLLHLKQTSFRYFHAATARTTCSAPLVRSGGHCCRLPLTAACGTFFQATEQEGARSKTAAKPMPDISRFIRPAGMMEMRYVRLLSRLAFYQACSAFAAAAAGCFALCLTISYT